MKFGQILIRNNLERLILGEFELIFKALKRKVILHSGIYQGVWRDFKLGIRERKPKKLRGLDRLIHR